VSDSSDAPLYAFRHNVVVSASAGTGKTFRLVTLYALLALGLTSRGAPSDDVAGPPVLPTRIAATTFSRAAAAEIRERVERLLRAIASGVDDVEMRAYLGVLEARAAETGSPAPRSPSCRTR
jgi:ATP-dependent exoDNAse (exonuclease V) beta subunit